MTDRSERESGIALLSALALILVTLGLVGALSAMSTLGLRANSTNERLVRAFYLADSGAQIGNQLILSTNGSVAPYSATEAIAGGSVTIDISQVSSNVYRVRSTGTFEGVSRQVESHFESSSTFALEGAIELMFSNSVELETSNLPIRLDGTSTISGVDHLADGTIAADQSGAKPGLALGPVPGSVSLSTQVGSSATLEGAPSATISTSQDNRATIQQLRNHVKNNAAVSISGSRTLGASATGSYGTAASPVMVRARLGEEQTLHLTSSFEGHGTLIVEVGEAEDAAAFRMSGDAKWHGLVVLQFRDEAEVEGGALIFFEDNAELFGGVVLDFRGDEVELEDGGRLIRTRDAAQIRYSSTLVQNAPGISALGLSGIVALVSYQIL